MVGPSRVELGKNILDLVFSFVNGEKLPTFLIGIKFYLSNAYLVSFCGKTKEGI